MTDNGPASPMPETEWCDAPPARRQGGPTGSYDSLIAQLKAKSGQWARWQEPTEVKAGSRSQYLRKLGLESTSRAIDGSFFVYARYVGDES